MGEFKGYISKQFTVWCGECGNWEQVEAELKLRAEREFKRRGWKNTKDGWVCPKCLVVRYG